MNVRPIPSHPVALRLPWRVGRARCHRGSTVIGGASSAVAGLFLALLLLLASLLGGTPAACGQDPEFDGATVVLDEGETTDEGDGTTGDRKVLLPPKGTLLFLVQPKVLRDSSKARSPIPGARSTDLFAATSGTFGLEPLSSGELVARDLTWETFAEAARETARAHLGTLKPEIKRDDRGIAEYAMLRSPSPVTHTVIFIRDFLDLFEPILGDRLLVAIPDRHTVYVFPRTMGTFRTFGKEISALYLDALYPASAELFEVDADGLRAAGSFLEPD